VTGDELMTRLEREESGVMPSSFAELVERGVWEAEVMEF
jgi:hypothetical protein